MSPSKWFLSESKMWIVKRVPEESQECLLHKGVSAASTTQLLTCPSSSGRVEVELRGTLDRAQAGKNLNFPS